MKEDSKNIIVSLVVGIAVNIITAYLLVLNKLDIVTFAIIFTGSFIVIIIVNVQAKTSKIENELEKQKSEQTRLAEKLKIYEQLINIKRDIQELQQRVFKK